MSETCSFRLPNFIGVGPPRTATTWLHEALSGRVGLPQGVKETDFFNWQYEKGLEWYAAHFRHCPPNLPMGEFSPNYFGSAKTRERIATDIPNCQIICTLRDPVARSFSHYRKMREGEYSSASFEESIDKRPNLIGWSKYATHVTEWRKLFGKERVLVLLQDDLRADPQAFLDRVCNFIAIPTFVLNESKIRNDKVNAISNLPKYPRIAKAARIARDHLQKRGYYRVVNAFKDTKFRDFFFSGGDSFEPIRSETEARLREIFRPDIETLEEMLGRDLSAWKTPKPRASSQSNR